MYLVDSALSLSSSKSRLKRLFSNLCVHSQLPESHLKSDSATIYVYYHKWQSRVRSAAPLTFLIRKDRRLSVTLTQEDCPGL